MKTTIVSVSKQDDLYSIQDKLTWNKSGKVLLKLEEGNTTFLSRKELALLLRYANSIGSQIGIVTEVRAIRFSAQRYGIPVFRTLREAQQKGWQQSKESNLRVDEAKRLNDLQRIQSFTPTKRKELPFILRLIVFFVAVLAVLSLVAFFIPSASVNVEMQTDQQELAIPIQASTDLSAIDLSGTLPVYTRQLTINLTDQVQCSGLMEVPVSKARGDILIQNLTETEIEVPVGTVFSSSTIEGIRFASLESATLPAGVNETIKIPIEALSPGISGNVAENTINSVEGNLGLFITVSNPDALSGGMNQSAHTPTVQDLAKLRAQLMHTEVSQAEDQFISSQTEGELFVPGSIRIIEITHESYEPELGQPSEILKMEQEVVVEGWFLHRTDVSQVMKTILDAQLDPGWVAGSDDLVYEATASPRLSGNTLNWQFNASRSLKQAIPVEKIRKNIVGKTPQQALAAISQLGITANQVDLQVYPNWWHRLPFLENRIEVTINETLDGH